MAFSEYINFNYNTLNQKGDSAMIIVFDIWLVESGYCSLTYAQEAFPKPQKISKGQWRPKFLMMAIKGHKFKIVLFYKSFCLIYAQKPSLSLKKSLKV